MLNFLFTQTPLIFFVQSFWRDEAFSYLLAKQSWLNILILTAKDFNPPLYYLLLHIWIKIFGPSEIAIRCLSVVFFMICLYWLQLFMDKILKIKSKWIWLYFALFALNPLLNYYAFEARMYMMFAALALISFYFLIRGEYKQYVAATVLGLYTHYFMLLVLVVQGVFILLASNHKKTKIVAFKNITLVFVFFVPWLIFLVTQHVFSGLQTWITDRGLNQLHLIPGILYTGYESKLGFFNNLLLPLSLFLYLLLALGWKFLKPKKNNNLLSLLLLWTFFPVVLTIIVSLYTPLFLARYLIFSTLGLLLLVVYLMEKMNSKLKVTFFIILLLFTLTYNQLQVHYRKKAPLKDVILQIKEEATVKDLLYVTDVLDFQTAQYYFGEDKVFIYGKSYDMIPAFVGKVLISKDKFISTLPAYPRRAFVLKDDQSYNIESSF